eukprot:CAMPEP_0169079650 /NCGR_PEP_ID=MMETSP1015-20121227/10058_1 /TAXON_ID=342587 /ORGANISM="Karlodinium micrum, Strain CCMP2283" /LENGTH=540 /DNA_ID=CAMNT_0009139321 /DNA_START=74 /DNA_END=1696 /DNA_ORIENTATION=-
MSLRTIFFMSTFPVSWSGEESFPLEVDSCFNQESTTGLNLLQKAASIYHRQAQAGDRQSNVLLQYDDHDVAKANATALKNELADQITSHGKVLFESKHKNAVPSCSPLTNQGGSFYSVNLGVGTPRQYMEVVVDTGSDNVLIPWCGCPTCEKNVPCFKVSQSSTLSLTDLLVEEEFGSGAVDSVLSSDYVSVGASVAYMQDSLFVIVLEALDVGIDGILGLGNPYGDGIPSFLQEAGLTRFSVCMDDYAGGVLRLGNDAVTNRNVVELGAAGRFHWALTIGGVSATSGGNVEQVPICANQASPCAAITDTGTTNILGPPEQLIALFTALCTSWPRCQASAASAQRALHTEFLVLLNNCQDWIFEGAGLDELPDIQFNMVGSNGNTQTLSISADHYTYSILGPASYAQEDLKGIFPDWLNDHPTAAAASPGTASSTTTTTTSGYVCAPSFSSFVDPIAGHGFAWILGLPLFFSYEVQFSMLGAGSIAFQKQQGGCQSCEEISLMSVSSTKTQKQRGPESALPHLRTKPSRGPSQIRIPPRI